jgi:anhydro-N-acetylmuramic acid kinase
MAAKDTTRAIGVMSGTSCDGVDAVLLSIGDADVRGEPEVLGHAFVPYPQALRKELTEPARISTPRICELDYWLPSVYAEAIQKLPSWKEADVVGCHGQTVWHAPPSAGADVPGSLQLGSPSALAARLGLVVVGDFRAADIARGGEGAPIAPIAHYMFTPEDHTGRLVVNVGGIANVTHITERREDVTAADVGPGNMIADRLCAATSLGGEAFDRDGLMSRDGTVHEEVVEHILAHPFFSRPEPRTTGREDFGVGYTDSLTRRFSKLSAPDLLRSALAATAEVIARTARAKKATEILLTGGGAKNPTLREIIGQRAGTIPIAVAESGAFAPSVHEPAAMALIAARTIRGLPSSLPRVTGAKSGAVLGVVARP